MEPREIHAEVGKWSCTVQFDFLFAKSFRVQNYVFLGDALPLCVICKWLMMEGVTNKKIKKV